MRQAIAPVALRVGVAALVLAALAALKCTTDRSRDASAIADAQKDWPNVPTGFAPLADESFDDAKLARAWSLIWNTAGNGSMVSTVTSPFSPGGVLQLRYPAGFVGGTAPAALVYRLGRTRNVFIGIWWKASTDWQGHASSVNGIQLLFPSRGRGDVYMAAYGTPGGPYELRCALQLVNGDTRDWLRPNVDSGRVTMGQWHRIEWLLQYNTSGLRNGVVRWWLDGRLVGDYRDVLFPGAPMGEYQLSPTWGGVGGAKAQTDYYWYDHVFIARR